MLTTGICAGVNGFVGSRMPHAGAVYIWLYGGMVAGMDLLYRIAFYRSERFKCLLDPSMGGHVMGVPMWVWGLLFAALGFYEW